MEKIFNIASYCSFRNHKIHKNGDLWYQDEQGLSIKDFAKNIYKKLEIKYPKFYKMDDLCKLSFLATEILVEKDTALDENTALVLANRASSLTTDRKHQESINDAENYFPSPAVFVYTLPNIALGEISIRHQLKSENAFFVSSSFDVESIFSYAQVLLDTNKASSVICGWVDLDTNNYDVFLTYLKKDQGENKTTQELINIYNTDYGRIS